MNIMLGDLVDKCVVFYLDNMLIFLNNEVDYKEHVHLVFERLA